MPKIRVFRFKAYEPTRDEYVISQRLGTREAIESSAVLEIISTPSWAIDTGLLDGNGMTGRLLRGRIAQGALDDHGNAYVLLEAVSDDSGIEREAFRLMPNATLQHAEQIATDYNRHGTLHAIGGPPLVGDQIPRLHLWTDG